MSATDAIAIGEGWISEHYFTTDAKSQSFRAQVIARRKVWDAEEPEESVRSSFSASRTALLSLMSALDDVPDNADEIRRRLTSVLGYETIGLSSETAGPVSVMRQVSIPDGQAVALLAARPVETVESLLAKDLETLAEPLEVDDTTELASVAQALSHLFVADDGPDFALVFAGRIMLLAERERWPEGRYLALDLQLICERNDDKRGGEIDTALTCISAESLAPDVEGNIWWHTALGESIRHTVGVSEDLREGVRLSIEIIANDVVVRRELAGLGPLPQAEAQPLAKQSLRFLYRILFLLYAEASPELGVLPTGAVEYDQGYSLDRLRDLIQTPLNSPHAERGTHLYDSLAVLFRLVDAGYEPTTTDGGEGLLDALTFRSLRADLFRPEATAFIDQVKLGNLELQRVLQHLLLSKEKRGSDRGFISYAELGINQLGAVYEGLMSYTGRFAETDLYEVAKGGDGSKGTWLVPVERSVSIDAKDFVRSEDAVTGEMKPVLHGDGTFVFRLAGRERQQSASYYTPEVLTRFTVSQALQELLDQEGHTTTAEEILKLTVCEPALGSGAFAIEAVRQLAAEYLTRRQAELGERIDPDEYPRELQRVKAYLALHNVYGVDRNATAVELAEISLWLDTMVEGLQAPWFGLHLRRGNSLIGARRAVYTKGQVEKKTWLKAVPTALAMTAMPAAISEGQDGLAGGIVHHFLLPADGWGSAIHAKEAKLAPEALDSLKRWRKQVLVKLTKKQVDTLIGIARRVETLWQLAWQRLTIAEGEIRRSIEIWGADDLPVGGAVTREQIEQSLADANGAYRRLRLVMDAWAALWFWTLTEECTPPALDEWITTLRKLVGVAGKAPKTGQLAFGTPSAWVDLGVAEDNDLALAGAVDVTTVVAEHPWLGVARRIAEQQGFFHWELDFAPVFTRGGFDLQVGNPPWVRPRSDVEALLAEADPWWQLKGKSTAAQDAEHRGSALSIGGTRELLLEGTGEVAGTAAFLGAAAQYPHLAGLQPDLYRCFMELTWRHLSSTGTVGLIHLESHFTDENAGVLRRATYRRLRRHWQFINELGLFEIQNQKRYGVNIYGTEQEPGFRQAASLYHPDTVERSLKHDGSGAEPGIKDLNGKWDLRPHASRIIVVTDTTLASWHAVMEPEGEEVSLGDTRMVYTVNRSAAAVLDKLARAPRIATLDLRFSRGWDESIDRKKGFFDSEWGEPDSWDSVILQGSHVYAGNPFYKTPNSTMLNHRDWTETDLEALGPQSIPITSYKPRGDRSKYDAAYTQWVDAGGAKTPARSRYRVAWRNMAANTGERTLVPAIIPPGAAHVDGVYSAAAPSLSADAIPAVAGTLSSLLSDFAVRSAPKSNIRDNVARRLPRVENVSLRHLIVVRSLRLNCLTAVYRPLYEKCWRPAFSLDAWTGNYPWLKQYPLGPSQREWGPDVPLRLAGLRRQAQLEIDALVALGLGVTADELCTIYSTQFPVLVSYDKTTSLFDAHGRLVPYSVQRVWRTKHSALSDDERRATHAHSGAVYTYELPFGTLDREADMRTAYAEFERRLGRDNGTRVMGPDA